MKTVFFLILCEKQLLKAGVENWMRLGTVYVCVVDAPHVSLPVGCIPLSPLTLLGEDWRHKAFCFDKEEFMAACELEALARLASPDTRVICLRSGAKLEENFQLADIEDLLAVPCLEKTPAFVLEEESPEALLANDCLAVVGGPCVTKWLAWCQERASRTLRAMNGVRAVRCRVPKLLEEWAFFKQWRRMALYFGCRLLPLNAEVIPGEPMGWKWDAFADGTPILPVLREYYAQDYYLRDDCQNNPFIHPENFFERSVILGEENGVPFTASMLAIYQMRLDLWNAFPEALGAQREAYTKWYLENVQKEYGVPEAYVAAVRQAVKAAPVSQPEKKKRAFGVNLCGLIKGDFGLGESCRSMARALEAAQIPYTIVDSQAALGQRYTNEEFTKKISNTFPYKINLFDINGNGMEEFFRTTSRDVLKERYNIGYWAWELPEAVPKDWEPAYKLLDEIWTCSDFAAEAIRKTSPIPVRTIPHVVCVKQDEQLCRADFGLPDGQFLFLMMYDVSSVTARKNPEGAVQAFLEAFGDGDEAGLVIKVNAPMGWDCDDTLLCELASNRNVYPLIGNYSKQAIDRLMALCDATVSLHRSEGFGLVPAETMALGKPVILTDWSGSTMYAKPEACCPVPYKIVELERDYSVYKKGSHWAEPDIHAAAAWMKKLVADAAFYDRVAAQGKKVVQEEFSPKAIGVLVRQRLEEISSKKEKE